MWKRQKKTQPVQVTIPQKNNILPEGFFKVISTPQEMLEGESLQPFVVVICQGKYKDNTIEIWDIKIRKHALTSEDQMLYNFKVVQPEDAFYSVEELQNLNRIVGAIICDIYSDTDDQINPTQNAKFQN